MPISYSEDRTTTTTFKEPIITNTSESTMTSASTAIVDSVMWPDPSRQKSRALGRDSCDINSAQLPQLLSVLMDYLSYLVGVASHECFEGCVCVVRLNLIFSDDIVDCATDVWIDNLFRAGLTHVARVIVETSGW